MEPDQERVRIEAAQKDPRRFAELYEEHFHRVFAFIARRVHDRGVAEDLTAEVFHQALANLPRFEWRGAPFASWLFRIASNGIADHFRRVARERNAPEAVEITPNEIEKVEQRALLFRMVDQLPADQRRVVVMRFAQQRPIREIAQELGKSEGAVKQLQWRALQTLRSKLDRQHA